MTKVKICGITRLADALAAARAGADFLGLVFYPKSPRYISPDAAASLVAQARAHWGGRGPYWVGVFVNTRPKQIRRIMAQVGLDLAQLHGDEPVAWVAALEGRGYKALRLRGTPEAFAARVAAYAAVGPTKADWPQVLVDAYTPHAYGGSGQV
ncbi:MAG: N-(5'-phosphoribosyl)anthranilate isomerase, partial [Chloroflexi bacterium]|nr:N-(5'-phosphoribosyl)anthranilate isomerase [Chloroflexota bacterium]